VLRNRRRDAFRATWSAVTLLPCAGRASSAATPRNVASDRHPADQHPPPLPDDAHTVLRQPIAAGGTPLRGSPSVDSSPGRSQTRPRRTQARSHRDLAMNTRDAPMHREPGMRAVASGPKHGWGADCASWYRSGGNLSCTWLSTESCGAVLPGLRWRGQAQAHWAEPKQVRWWDRLGVLLASPREASRVASSEVSLEPWRDPGLARHCSGG
jgi:hypothetical protein